MLEGAAGGLALPFQQQKARIQMGEQQGWGGGSRVLCQLPILLRFSKLDWLKMYTASLVFKVGAKKRLFLKNRGVIW